MAVTYGFYNALNHDRLYDAIQMSSIFDGIIRDGIFSTIGDHMVVSAPEDGWYVNVGSGRAWFNHTWTLNDTDYPIEPEEAEVVLDRIDAVILEVNAGAEVRANSIKFLKGTPSSEPVKPTLTHNAEVNQYALAYVRIRAGQTTIFQTDIENAIGTDETPFITGLLQQVSIETLLTQWEAEFNTYFTNFQSTSTTEFNNWLATKVAEYTLWYAQMQTDMDADFAEFDAWFQRMKDQLSEDAAGHLQAEIDELAEAAQKGSIVTVTTTDPTLFNRPVTISQTGFDPVTSSFDASGVAYFETVPMVGDVAIEATNGTLTAHGILNIPYFGRYNTTLEFWEAILDISTSMTSLYNRQITVTKNSSTIGTTTFDATGHATFAVHSVGTYNVSATDSLSHTYDVDVEVTEETTYLVDLVGEIDGATVTPTDDIQTWLKCANITDKSYTTLAEVLADRETFETLIADSNACDYMARSTTWAGNPSGEIPTMTSDTTPSGIVTSSQAEDTTNVAWKVFDKNNDTRFLPKANQSASDYFIKYDFGKNVNLCKVKLKYVSYNGSWQYAVLGSADDIDYTQLCTKTTTSGGSSQYFDDEFTFDNDVFRYVKLVLLNDLSPHTANVRALSMYEIQFYGGVVNNQDAMALIGKYDYCSNALLSNATWASAIANSDYFEEVLNVKIPVMTSDTTPSGVAYVLPSNAGSGYEAYRAFDGNSSTMSAATGTRPYRLGYQFTQPVKVKKVVAYSNYANATGILRASNDNSTWKEIKILNHDSQTKEYIITESSEAFTYWEIESTQEYSWGSFDMYSLQFYGRASGEVFVPLVPTMTSNTTPSGECIRSSVYSSTYEAFKAFDNNASTWWNANGGVGEWVGYTFTQPVVVNKLYLYAVSTSKVGTLKVQASNDGFVSDIHDISSDFTPSSFPYNLTLENNTAYSSYRIINISGTTDLNIYELQFYQKTVQTNIIHSAPNDTIYMMENGSQMPLCTTNSDGDGVLDFSQLPAGPVTLYSSVAKNPDDLTADYSKTITITKTQYGGTTEAYVMPDTAKTLYWWGYNSATNPIIAINGSDGWDYTSSGYAFNTNNVSASGNQGYAGICATNKIRSTKFHGIGFGNGYWGPNNLIILKGKQIKTTATWSKYTGFETTISHKTVIPDDSDEYTLATSYGGTSQAWNWTIYALWYE